MAFDDSADDVREWAEGIGYPVLVDRQHLLSELYAISNVPTVIWIDENDRIVRPNDAAFSVDMFRDFTGFDSAEFLDAVRAWVTDDVIDIAPELTDGAVDDLSPDEVAARLHFRIAAWARRDGNTEAAERHFRLAAELAPNDFTVRRAAMPLLGVDPFGDAFFELYGEWQANGSPYHGLQRRTG